MWMFRFVHGLWFSIWSIICWGTFLFLMEKKEIRDSQISFVIIMVSMVVYLFIVEYFINPRVEKFMDKFWEKRLQTVIKKSFDKSSENSYKNICDKIKFRQFGICPFYTFGPRLRRRVDGGYKKLDYPSLNERVGFDGKLYNKGIVNYRKGWEIDIDDLQSKFKDV